MARLSAKPLFVTLVALGLTQAGYAGPGVPVLKTNPFASPLGSQTGRGQPGPSKESSSVPFVLRGTMMAGQQSLADISGVIVPLGKDINGYKLVAVRQREVVLLKGKERRILSVDNKDEGK